VKNALLHVLRSLNPADGGPAEVVRQICLAHAEAGEAAEVVTLDPPMAPWLAGWPVPIHALRGRGGYGWTPELEPWLRKRAVNFAGVFVHGLWQWQGAGTLRGLRNTGTPYFLFPHGMLDPWFRGAHPWRHARKALYWRMMERRVLSEAAAVVFTCEEERDLGRETFRPWQPQREAIVSLGTRTPPGAQSELAARFFLRFPELRGQRLLLFLGRLHEKKGCDLLLAALRKVRPPMHLVLAGPCADERFGAHLRALAAGLPVTFTGPVYGEDKWAALAAAEVFALPSHQENFGIAVTEALASGLPALLSRKVNIWREIVEDGAGFAETDTAEGTARLLEQWLLADRNAMRAAAARCFSERFDIRRTAANLVALIHPPP
jgi:glycosyltransferase involved in cell wall biosynthesis